MKKEGFILSVVILIGAFLRFWQLGQVPFGATLDEMGYIYNAYSISQTGKNVFGQSFPLFTWMVPGGFPFMPIPIYLSAPLFWILNLSLTTGRLLPAFFGTVDLLLVYILVKQLFQKSSLALLASLFLAISPWHLHFSRSAYDINYALFFYLSGIVIFLWENKKKKLPIISVISFLLAIFSYRGMSIIAIPLFAILFWYASRVLRSNRRQLIGFVVGVFIIGACFFSVILLYKSSYTAEGIALFNNPKMSDDINRFSREARGPLILKRIFFNKPTYIINTFRENYVKSMSFEFLFLFGEGNAIYSIWSRGKMYFVDLFFVILGIGYLYSLRKKEMVFITLLLLIGALPGGIGGFPISARNFFQSALFPIFSASGVIFLIDKVDLKILKYFSTIFIAILYIYAFSSYLFDYYERYAYQQAEAWGKSFKDMSAIIIEGKDKYQKILIGPTTHGDFIQLAFYSKLKSKEVQEAWKYSDKKHEGPFTYENITFLPLCSITEKTVQEKSTMYITRGSCNEEATPSAYINDFWQNPVWKIYAL